LLYELLGWLSTLFPGPSRSFVAARATGGDANKDMASPLRERSSSCALIALVNRRWSVDFARNGARACGQAREPLAWRSPRPLQVKKKTPRGRQSRTR
jgi:hypothetical protein